VPQRRSPTRAGGGRHRLKDAAPDAARQWAGEAVVGFAVEGRGLGVPDGARVGGDLLGVVHPARLPSTTERRDVRDRRVPDTAPEREGTVPDADA